MTFLQRCADLVAAGGILVLVTPYSFSEDYTPKVGGGISTLNMPSFFSLKFVENTLPRRPIKLHFKSLEIVVSVVSVEAMF